MTTMQTTGDALLQAILEEPEAAYLRGIYKDWLLDHDQWDGERLLGFVLRHPESDGVCLLYADWAEGHGQPERAEFIRVQVELAKPQSGCDRFLYSCSEILTRGENRATDLDRLADGGCEPCKRWAMLTLRQERLLTTAHFWEWFPETGKKCTGSPAVAIDSAAMTCEVGYFNGDDNSRPKYYFVRGFIHAVDASLDTLLAHLPGLLLRHPVQEVRVTDKRPMDYTTETEPHFTWWEETKILGLVGPECLPTATWESLDRHVELSDVSLRQFDARDYLTEADALAALSRAVLEVCKKDSNIIKLKGRNT